MQRKCLRCLLYEAGESVTYEQIMAYAATLNKKDLVDKTELDRRLQKCRECDFLISGMCRKCGCYVEIRARLKNQSCPNYDDKKW